MPGPSMRNLAPWIACLAIPSLAQAVVVGSLSARFDDTLRGGSVVVAGASLSGRSDGVPNTNATITIAGIPAGAVVQRVFLYWAISGGSDTTATINGQGVTGANILIAGGTCWGPPSTATFRAEVGSLVPGNGNYVIAGLPSSINPGSPDTNGAALVVVYSRPASGILRRIMIRDGAITTDNPNDQVTDTFTGVMPPISSVGRFHLIVGDGQVTPDGVLQFNGATLGTDQFSGGEGPLWDVVDYDVLVTNAIVNATWSHVSLNDCLLFETAILEFDVAECGDGLITATETCDDGDPEGGDGCSATCEVEAGWACTGVPSVCTILPDALFRDGFE